VTTKTLSPTEEDIVPPFVFFPALPSPTTEEKKYVEEEQKDIEVECSTLPTDSQQVDTPTPSSSETALPGEK
jgi:hypothetical protein